MNHRANDPDYQRLLLFAVIVLSLLAGGYTLYHFEVERLRNERYGDLSAIGGLKVDQIHEWRREQLRHVRLNAEDPLMRQAVGDLLSPPVDLSARQELRRRLQLVQEVYNYDDALLLTPDGDHLLAATENPGPVNEATAAAVARALANEEAVLSHLYHDLQEVVHLDAVAPIQKSGEAPAAVVVLRSNASTLLFPLIQNWPTPSASAETLLVRRDNDTVLFLNELRHRSGAPFSLRVPLTQRDLPAVQAVQGHGGQATGEDYRGVPVLAHLQAVPDSDWALVAKWDESEIQAEIWVRAAIITLVVTLFILLAGASLAFLYRQRQAKLYRDLYHAEQERHQFLEEQRAILHSIGDAVITTNAQGQVTFLNPVAESLTGHQQEAAQGRPLAEVFSIVNSHTRQPRQNPIAEVLEGGQIVGLANHTTLIARDGSEYQIADSAAPIRDADGDINGTVLVFRDVSEAYEMEEALRASERRFRLLFTNAVSGIALHEIILDESGEPVDYRFLDANVAFETQTGLAPAEVIGQRASEILPGIEETSFIEIYGRVALTGEPVSFERYAPMLDRHYLVHAYQTAPGQFAAVFQDISERKRAELALRDHHRELEQVFATMPEAMIYTDPERRIMRVNTAFVRIFGYEPEDVNGEKTAVFYANPDDYKAQGMERYNPQVGARYEPYEVEYRRKNGEFFVGETVGSPIRDNQGQVMGMLGLIRDVSARKKAEEERRLLEEQLHQAQKLESIGRLAGGVAHDFNNMLSVIGLHTQLALRQIDSSHPANGSLQHVLDAAQRSADLTRQLLAFARKQTIDPQVLDLNEVVGGMLEMLRRLIGEAIDLAWRPASDLWPMKLDPAQVDQILANLCINARDAIEDVGKITVETDNVVIDEAYCRSHAGFLPGEYVMLSVTDNGHGMDKETLTHIFEPFFSTKKPGEGTGLGLATIYGIVKQNKGFINVYSEPDQGTTFRIYLPRHADDFDRSGLAPPAEEVTGGTEMILLVEDEPAILDAVRALLDVEGYRTLTADNPNKALQLAQEHAGEIQLLLTDMVMPEMNGRDLADRLLALYPELKCLFMSGYTANTIAHQSLLDEDLQFIQKPFTAETLNEKIRQLLQE